MAYSNELSSFFFSCGDGAISFSSTFHAFCELEMSDRSGAKINMNGTHISDVECGLRGELISQGAVLMRRQFPSAVQLYPTISTLATPGSITSA